MTVEAGKFTAGRMRKPKLFWTLVKPAVSGRAKNCKDSSLGGTVLVVVSDFYYCRGKWTGNSTG